MKLFTVVTLGIAIFGTHFNNGLRQETPEVDSFGNLDSDNYLEDEEIPDNFDMKGQREYDDDYDDDDREDDENVANRDSLAQTNRDSEVEMAEAVSKGADEPRKFKRAPIRIRRIARRIRRKIRRIRLRRSRSRRTRVRRKGLEAGMPRSKTLMLDFTPKHDFRKIIADKSKTTSRKNQKKLF